MSYPKTPCPICGKLMTTAGHARATHIEKCYKKHVVPKGWTSVVCEKTTGQSMSGGESAREEESNTSVKQVGTILNEIAEENFQQARRILREPR